MYEPLTPCSSCARHVRTSDRHCPFCKASLPEAAASGVSSFVPRNISRAAALALSASLIAGGPVIAGCGKTTGAPDDNGSTAAAYGVPAPPFDGQTPVVVPSASAASTDAAITALTDATAPADAAADAAKQPPKKASATPAKDAGRGAPDDFGGMVALYGAPVTPQ